MALPSQATPAALQTGTTAPQHVPEQSSSSASSGKEDDEDSSEDGVGSGPDSHVIGKCNVLYNRIIMHNDNSRYQGDRVVKRMMLEALSMLGV